MTVKVELSKNKSYIMLLGFIAIALISLLLLLSACGIFFARIPIEPFALVVFSLLLISSAYFIYLTIKKINSKQPGLIVNQEGFTYNATALGIALGYIEWKDIKTLTAKQGLGNSYLAVEVHNPEHYLSRIKSSFLRKQTQKRIYKSEKHRGILLGITANDLQKYNFDKLEKLLTNGLDNFRSKS